MCIIVPAARAAFPHLDKLIFTLFVLFLQFVPSLHHHLKLLKNHRVRQPVPPRVVLNEIHLVCIVLLDSPVERYPHPSYQDPYQ